MNINGTRSATNFKQRETEVGEARVLPAQPGERPRGPHTRDPVGTVRVRVPACICALAAFLEVGKVLEHSPDNEIEKAAPEKTQREQNHEEAV